MIDILNLSKNYGNVEVLKGVNLKLNKGKVYGLVGANGSGKTTLFRCIAGLESFVGEIQCDANKIKDQLGYLTTDPYFFDKITGREYIQLFCNAKQIPIPDLEIQNIFDLPLDRYARSYSTGMKKKLALTAILLQKNDIYILDEPYNGVDIQSSIMITSIIHKLRSVGKTMLISSHIFSTLKDTCDEIFLLENGVICLSGTKSEFDHIDQQMQQRIVGNSLDLLDL